MSKKEVGQQSVDPAVTPNSVQSDEVHVVTQGEGPIPREPGDSIPFFVTGTPVFAPPEPPAADGQSRK